MKIIKIENSNDFLFIDEFLKLYLNTKTNYNYIFIKLIKYDKNNSIFVIVNEQHRYLKEKSLILSDLNFNLLLMVNSRLVDDLIEYSNNTYFNIFDENFYSYHSTKNNMEIYLRRKIEYQNNSKKIKTLLKYYYYLNIDKFKKFKKLNKNISKL